MPSENRRYQLLFKIASGGMAEVFAARYHAEAGFERIVAVKRMHPHLAEDGSFVERFLEEARMAARIASPHVVQTVDIGLDADRMPFLVMELVRGVSLSTLLSRSHTLAVPVPLPVVVDLLSQMAKGLVAVHEARTLDGRPMHLVHRDVSPQNLLLDGDGHCRVSDFGIAKAMARLTEPPSHGLEGKRSYMSPEQVRCETLDARSDLFSVGIIAWEMLTGSRLFGGGERDAVLDRVLSEPIPSARALRPDVPPSLADVVARLLERPRERRVQTAAELLQRLTVVARDCPVTGAQDGTAALVRLLAGQDIEELEERLRGARAEREGGTVTVENTLAEPDALTATALLGAAAGSSATSPTGDHQVIPIGRTWSASWRRTAAAVTVLGAIGAATAGYWALRQEAAKPAPMALQEEGGRPPVRTAESRDAVRSAPIVATDPVDPVALDAGSQRLERTARETSRRRRPRPRRRWRPAAAPSAAPRPVAPAEPTGPEPDHALLSLDDFDDVSRGGEP